MPPVYKDPDAEWLWNNLCAITQQKYTSNNLAFAWMIGFLITTLIELMRNDSTTRAHVIKKLKQYNERPRTLSDRK